MNTYYEDDKTCECCEFEGAKTRVFQVDTWRNVLERRPMHLCEICSSTYLSIAVKYPQQVDVNLYKSIAWIANKILSAIVSGNAPSKDVRLDSKESPQVTETNGDAA